MRGCSVKEWSCYSILKIVACSVFKRNIEVLLSVSDPWKIIKCVSICQIIFLRICCQHLFWSQNNLRIKLKSFTDCKNNTDLTYRGVNFRRTESIDCERRYFSINSNITEQFRSCHYVSCKVGSWSKELIVVIIIFCKRGCIYRTGESLIISAGRNTDRCGKNTWRNNSYIRTTETAQCFVETDIYRHLISMWSYVFRTYRRCDNWRQSSVNINSACPRYSISISRIVLNFDKNIFQAVCKHIETIKNICEGLPLILNSVVVQLSKFRSYLYFRSITRNLTCRENNSYSSCFTVNTDRSYRIESYRNSFRIKQEFAHFNRSRFHIVPGIICSINEEFICSVSCRNSWKIEHTFKWLVVRCRISTVVICKNTCRWGCYRSVIKTGNTFRETEKDRNRISILICCWRCYTARSNCRRSSVNGDLWSINFRVFIAECISQNDRYILFAVSKAGEVRKFIGIIKV